MHLLRTFYANFLCIGIDLIDTDAKDFAHMFSG